MLTFEYLDQLQKIATLAKLIRDYPEVNFDIVLRKELDILDSLE